MLYNIDNACYRLLQALGCDLSAIDSINTWKQFGVLVMEFLFAVFMLALFCKFVYNMMIRAFKGAL